MNYIVPQKLSNYYFFSKRNNQNMRKITTEEAQKIFEEKGCKILGEYVSLKAPVKFRCFCGRECESSLFCVRRDNFIGCVACRVEKGAKRVRWTQKDAENLFSNMGMSLLSSLPKNRKEKINFVCKCGRNSSSRFDVSTRPGWCGCSFCAKEQEKKTKLQKYGHVCVLRSEYVLGPIREKYGETGFMGTKEFRGKARRTLIENTGYDHPSKNPEVQKKKRENSMVKYGVSHPFKLEETRKKAYGTYKAKTGYDHPSQNPEVASKKRFSSFRKKEFIMPSGAPFVCQGFEPLALQLLLDEGIDEQDILSPSEQGIKIPYEFQGKSHMYHPDIFVPSLYLLIEVKSDWTFSGCGGKKQNEAERTLKKLAACREQGYNTRLYVFDKNNNLASFHERISPTNF
ncbi:conserved putative MutH/Vsr/archaeal HJR-like endonuclease [Melbournevirus]|uniref:conserved putative MutH/Vsr/archaeal HJR-like endonuclease n=1 Tax=Melbournevirus TaxID=1560514 RepID=UPI00051F569F|nr:conserved putative MutH/Vsr/archaeal HJR-like endonuclease [Melbournevirus]AIT54836.1 hypothetical protein MEL_223 [Melbournevirus]